MPGGCRGVPGGCWGRGGGGQPAGAWARGPVGRGGRAGEHDTGRLAGYAQPVADDPRILVDALDHTWGSVVALCEPLGAREWSLPTPCPGWSVKDIVAHLAGIERTLQGRPQPAHDLPDYPWLRNDVGRFMEVAIDVRRPWPPDRVLAEFREVTQQRLEALRAGELDPTAEVTGPLGTPAPLARMLTIRVLDSWTHEQDLRAALGVPGGMTSPAAAVTCNLIVKSLPHVARKAGLAPGERVAIEVAAPGVPAAEPGAGAAAAPPTEPVAAPVAAPVARAAATSPAPFGPAAVAVTVIGAETPSGRARVVPGIETGATQVRLGFREFTRRAGGRLGVAEALAGGGIEGDRELAERFLTELVITP